MADAYQPGIPGYQHNNQLDDGTPIEQSQLFRALMAQTMGGNSGTPGGAIAQMLGSGLNAYLATQGGQQPYSTDPTSANFMGPPAALAG